MKSRRKALRSLTQEKIVNIGDYRQIRQGRSIRRLAVVTGEKALFDSLVVQLQGQAELQYCDSRFSLEQSLKLGEWDGVVLDERLLHEDALSICEKLKKQTKIEDLFVVIISDQGAKELVRSGYERGCDEWITRPDDVTHLVKLLSHHLGG